MFSTMRRLLMKPPMLDGRALGWTVSKARAARREAVANP
jgi:hypothetical protein